MERGTNVVAWQLQVDLINFLTGVSNEKKTKSQVCCLVWNMVTVEQYVDTVRIC